MSKYTFDQVVTKTGDRGTSSDYDGRPHSKSSLLFEVLGGLDELSSWLGKIKWTFTTINYPFLIGRTHFKNMEDIQLWLQYGGSLVATEPLVYGEQESPLYEKLHKLSDKEVDNIEKWIKGMMDDGLKIKNGFVLPGNSMESADVHIARTVCRRVERLVVRFMMENEHRFDLKYLSIMLNRLSDYLFCVSIWLEQK
jgi:cob(I)alamin adenosyltransferase